MAWALLLNRYTLALLGAGAMVMAAWWAYSHIHDTGYNKAMAEVAARDNKAAIKALMAEMRRDDRAHRIVRETMDSGRELARINVTTNLSLERIRTLLPAVDPPQCVIPDGVWDELDQAHERAEAAAGERL